MVLSFSVLRRLPLCRCECASRPGWAVGGTEGARVHHVRPGIPLVRRSSAVRPRGGPEKAGGSREGASELHDPGAGGSATPGPCGGGAGSCGCTCAGNGVRGSPGSQEPRGGRCLNRAGLKVFFKCLLVSRQEGAGEERRLGPGPQALPGDCAEPLWLLALP